MFHTQRNQRDHGINSRVSSCALVVVTELDCDVNVAESGGGRLKVTDADAEEEEEDEDGILTSDRRTTCRGNANATRHKTLESRVGKQNQQNVW